MKLRKHALVLSLGVCLTQMTLPAFGANSDPGKEDILNLAFDHPDFSLIQKLTQEESDSTTGEFLGFSHATTAALRTVLTHASAGGGAAVLTTGIDDVFNGGKTAGDYLKAGAFGMLGGMQGVWFKGPGGSAITGAIIAETLRQAEKRANTSVEELGLGKNAVPRFGGGEAGFRPATINFSAGSYSRGSNKSIITIYAQ
jgi:hypothetical protein